MRWTTTDLRLGGVMLAAALLVMGCRERPGGGAESARASTPAAESGTDLRAESDAPRTASPDGPEGRGALARYRPSGAPARRITLPAELREISGLASTSDGRIFAHGDEEGTVVEIDPGTGQVLKQFHLAPSGRDPALGKKARKGRVAGDFEDIAVVRDRIFLVTSTGVLAEFGEGADGASVPYTAHATGLGNRCEVEGLAHDPAGALLLLCKELHAKGDRDRIEVYAWSLADRRLDPTPRLAVPYASIRRLIPSGGFNGSALAFMPGDRSLVLVAGPQRQYLEITEGGEVVDGGPLDRAALAQPEGIAFTKDGTLLVSSEGGRGQATLNAYVPR